MNEQELTELFRKLGARNPDKWAHSQFFEGLPQLARFLFLRQAWKLIVKFGDHGWLTEHLGQEPSSPGGGIGPAIERALALGVAKDDLTTIVRVMQWKILAGVCYLLDDSGNLEDEVKQIAWRLFQVDEEESPIAIMSGLHESVLDTDPAGHEMRDGPWRQTDGDV